MLVRLWHGVTPSEKADAYLDLMRNVAIPDYSGTPGNLNAFVLRKIDGDVAHFQMLTFWKDIDSIKAFAGEDYLVSKYYDFDRDFLIELVSNLRPSSVRPGPISQWVLPRRSISPVPH